MQIGLLVRICVGFALLVIAGPILADAPSKSELRHAASRIVDVRDIKVLTQTCPADIWRARRTWRHWLFWEGKKWDEVDCRNNISACTTECIDRLNGSACRAIALVLEKYGLPEFDMERRHGYSLACALGNPSGCTNRGATIRNAKTPSDAISHHTTEENLTCLYRTFSIACTALDAWGCAMEGLAHRLGQGTPVDYKKARARYNRTCSLSRGPEKKETGEAPCRFATDQLRLLKDPT